MLLDAKGPGALVRIWSASPAGMMRFYFDGETKPEIEVPFELLLTGKGPIPEPFAYVAAKGFNAYFPLPFQKGLKVTIDSLIGKNPWQAGSFERIYYHLSYRSYPEAVAPAFGATGEPSSRRCCAMPARACATCASRGSRTSRPRACVRYPCWTDGAELRATVDVSGGGAVRELSLLLRETSEAALARASISLRFDGETTVDTPLGDFFGTQPRAHAVRFAALHAASRRHAGLPLRRCPSASAPKSSCAGAPEREGRLLVEPRPFTPASLHFHARHRPPAVADSQPPKDLPMIAIEGRGVYVGDVFSIQNPNENWWGEGDEKIYVDGETFPSFFGTGTEDYYGYAWSTGELFFRALHAQTRAGGPGFSGTFSVNRFRTLDAIPFEKSLRFDMELWHWGQTRVTWQALIYYYADPERRTT